MKTIPLTRGCVAIVDDEDYEFLAQWKWYALKQPNTYYAARDIRVNGKKKTVWMHRLINNTPDGFLTDHKNGDGLDNQKTNLRTATHQQNMFNSARHKKWSSKYRGVSWHILNKRWVAQITVNRCHMNLGSFTTEEAARDAYIAKRDEMRPGQFIRTEGY